MNRKIVITGIGIISPAGNDKDTTWKNICNLNSVTRKISKFSVDQFESTTAGEITDFDSSNYMSNRLARKLDPFSQYAIAASKMAIDDAKLDLSQVDKENFGVFVGNCFGGWEYTDRELRKLHVLGVREVSPFQATAWFPAAPQGQISIFFGFRGHSKTIVSDRASGLMSVGAAAECIARKQCDLIIAGGTEALINSFTYSSCSTQGIFAKNNGMAPEQSYRPFDKKRNGLVPGEGAAFLVLEELSHAQKRGAHIYAEIHGYASTNDACFPNVLPDEESGLSKAMNNVISQSGISSKEVDFLVADGMATYNGDHQEASAIYKVFGSSLSNLEVTVPKSMIGHSYGAAGAMDIAFAAMGLKNQTIPPTVNSEEQDEFCSFNVTRKAVQRSNLSYAMVNARGTGGINASLLLGHPTEVQTNR